jgi:hypothetical protein
MVLRIVFSRHAEDMLAERSIERAWVIDTIRSPEIVEPDPNRPNVRRAFRQIVERENRFLRVAYVETADVINVVTTFFDRAKRR